MDEDRATVMGSHAEIVRQLPGVRGLRFGVVTQWSPEEAFWDGVGEVWFDSIEAANSAFAAEPHHSLLVADRRSFLGEAQSCFVEEHTVLAPPGADRAAPGCDGARRIEGFGRWTRRMLRELFPSTRRASGPGRPRSFAIE